MGGHRKQQGKEKSRLGAHSSLAKVSQDSHTVWKAQLPPAVSHPKQRAEDSIQNLGGSSTGQDFRSHSDAVCLPHHSTLKNQFSENTKLKDYSKYPLFYGETRFVAWICEQLFFKEEFPEGND